MIDSDSGSTPSGSAKRAGRSLYSVTLDALMTGVAIIVPFVVTLYVLDLALQFITAAFDPFVGLLEWLGVIDAIQGVQLLGLLVDLQVYPVVIGYLSELIAVVVLLGVILLVGFAGRNHYGELAIDFVDHLVASVPGIGTVYESFRRMGDVMLGDGSENFQEVKLIECLGEDVYLLGFETGGSPATVGQTTGHEDMVTVFIPLAPNPVTGGFLTYVPESKVQDVDMSIEEGVRSILTSGVASQDDVNVPSQFTMEDVRDVTEVGRLSSVVGEDDGNREQPDG